MSVAVTFPLIEHGRVLAIADARAHAVGWSLQFHDEMAFARKYAGTPFWKAAWDHFERAVCVTGPYALAQWQAYRALRGES